MSSDAAEAPQGNEPSQTGSSPWKPVAAILTVVVGLGLVMWVLLSGSGEGGGSPAASSVQAVSPTSATIVTAQEVAALPERVGHPVYWAGEIRGKDLELTILEDGTVYVRYIPAGLRPGVDRPAFLTVATYPRTDGYALVERAADQPGAVRVQDSGGSLVSAESEKSTNAFFAFQGVPLLVEVFDPEPGRAFTLIQSGRVQMVE